MAVPMSRPQGQLGQSTSHSLPDRHELLRAPVIRPRLPSQAAMEEMPAMSLPEPTPPTAGFVDICQRARDEVRLTRSLSLFSYSPVAQLAGGGKSSFRATSSTGGSLSTSPSILDTIKLSSSKPTPSRGPSALSMAFAQSPGPKPSALSVAIQSVAAIASPSIPASPYRIEKDRVDDSCTFSFIISTNYFFCNFFEFFGDTCQHVLTCMHKYVLQ
jgi:hypothetical protein